MFKKTQRILSYLVVASIAVLSSSVFSAESSLPYPKEAQIIHYPQIHLSDNDFSDSELDLNKDVIPAVAQSQLSLLRILRAARGDLQVFAEGFSFDLDKESIIDMQKSRDFRNLKDRVIRAFGNGLPKNIKTSTPEQIELLGIVSEGVVIALILGYVDKIYKAEDLGANEKAMAALEDSDRDSYYRKVFDEREEILKREIEKNFKEGDRALIVYGITHELSYLFDTIYRIPIELEPSMSRNMTQISFADWIDRLKDLRGKGHLSETVRWNKDGLLEVSSKLLDQFEKHPKKESFEVIAWLKNTVRRFKKSILRPGHKAQLKLGDDKEVAKKISACPGQFNDKIL